ncbi:MAG: hypothetical protein GXY50_06620 [Syntrophomonadaceae bacterium]|nr:hypothetical protein [Syntrophomonadaceae bacterium]
MSISGQNSIGTDIPDLRYVFFTTGDGHYAQADYRKAVTKGGAMWDTLQQRYAEALADPSGMVFFQDNLGFMYNWGENVKAENPLNWGQMRVEMMTALTAGDFAKIIPSYPFDRSLSEDGSLTVESYPLTQGSLELAGLTRNYYYYVPSSYDGKTPVPLMFSFHGINSSGNGQQSLTKLDALAEKEGFIMVYPDGQPLPEGAGILQADSMLAGYQGMWNFLEEGINDMEYISVLIDKLAGTDSAPGDFNIDRKRVYATGMSNGGIFCHKLAIELSDKIAAAVCVTGPMCILSQPKTPKRPITIIQASGNGDPILNWDGTEAYGTVSVDSTIAWWKQMNKTNTDPEIKEYPQTVEDDTTKVTKYTYGNGAGDTKVILYKIDEMGHTWPMGPQYLPIPLIGKVCCQFDLNEAIWEDIKDIRIPD